MKRICIFHVIIILFCELFGPSFGEVISQVQVVDAWTYLTGAYYLSADGVLYSPGADTDASAYTYYRDEYHWIVAENVASFGPMTGGGYFISRDGELVFWNQTKEPTLGITKTHCYVSAAQDIQEAAVGGNTFLYLNTHAELYAVGQINGGVFSMEEPLLLDREVRCFDAALCDEMFWIRKDGTIGICGGKTLTRRAALLENAVPAEQLAEAEKVMVTKNAILLLASGNLWYVGDIGLLSGKEAAGETVQCLGSGITHFTADAEMVAAVDEAHRGILWGKVLANGPEETEQRIYEYWWKVPVLEGVRNVSGMTDSLCFIFEDGTTGCYRSLDGRGYCGNSSNAKVVGARNQPVTWVPK